MSETAIRVRISGLRGEVNTTYRTVTCLDTVQRGDLRLFWQRVHLK
jgi:hypothetical protein